MAGVFEILGQGGFGTVHRVVRHNLQEVARKQFVPHYIQAYRDELYWFRKVQRPIKSLFIIDCLVCKFYISIFI